MTRRSDWLPVIAWALILAAVMAMIMLGGRT